MSELERKAQEAGEARLAYCQEMLYEDDHPDEPIRPPGEFEEPCGPYCGCETCIVREVLDAAWPFMLEMAREEAREEVNVE
jgi:hypothetical protein